MASFAGWQTGTCWSCRKGLPRPEWRLGAAGEGLASFAGWQTAALNVLKRTLPGPQGLVGAAGKVCRGLSGTWELQGRVWKFCGLANGSLERPEKDAATASC